MSTNSGLKMSSRPSIKVYLATPSPWNPYERSRRSRPRNISELTRYLEQHVNGSSQQSRNTDSDQHAAADCLTANIRSTAVLRNHPSLPQHVPRDTPSSDDTLDDDSNNLPLRLSDLTDKLQPKPADDGRYHSAIYTKLGMKSDTRNKKPFKELENKRFATAEEVLYVAMQVPSYPR